jgi:hypothetical protein
MKPDNEHIPAFHTNPERLRRCFGCGALTVVNHKKRCADCDHACRLQGFANAIVKLGTGGTDAEREMILNAIYESALSLVRE